MYSDLLESPSKGCFSFNDPFLPDDLAEMDDFTNQTNLDLIFDTYYSTRVSQCGTGFELPEDCINMSFSELFGQELLSTEENKDCKITIKIENNDSLDTASNHCLINAEESISSSSSSRSSIPKKGINRTFIKSTDICDVRHLINYPFCTDDLRDNQILMNPVIKQELKNTNSFIDKSSLEVETSPCSFAADFCNTTNCFPPKHQNINRKKSSNKVCGIENFNHHSSSESENLVSNQLHAIKMPKIKEEFDNTKDITEQNIVEMRLTQCNSVEASQNNIDDNIFVGFEEVPSNYHDINRAYVKLTDVKDLIYKSCNKNNVKNNQVPIETKKCKRVLANENIAETETVTFYPGSDSPIISDYHKSVKIQVVEKDHLSSQSDNFVQQLNEKNNASVKPTKNCSNKQLLVHKPFTEPSLVKATTSSIKNKLIDVNLDPTPCFFADKTHNTTVNHGKKLSIVSNEFLMEPKNNKSFNKIIKGHTAKHLMNKPYSHNLDTIKKNDVESSLSKSSSPKWHQVVRTSIETTDNHNDQKLTHKRNSKSKNQSIERSSLKTNISTIGQKSSVVNDVIKQNNVKLDVVPCDYIDNVSRKNNCPNIVKCKKDLFTALSESVISKRQGVRRSMKAIYNRSKQHMKTPAYENKDFNNGLTKEIKKEPIDHDVNLSVEGTLGVRKMIKLESKCVVDSNDFCSIGINNTNIESPNVVIVKEENKASFKNDINFQTIPVDNEKKKITWEEFRAKREKMGLLLMPDNNEDHSKDETTDTGELESILQEFDRNTAVHFIDKANKINDTEQNISDVKEIIKIEDLELQNISDAKKIIKIEDLELQNISDAKEINKIENFEVQNISDAKKIIKVENLEVQNISDAQEINKVENLELQNISDAKEINKIEDLELQNKRLKIEYFQKLIPTSIASELAKKTSLMRGISVEDNEIDSTSSDVSVFSGKTRSNSCNSQDDLAYLKQDDKSLKKYNQTRINSYGSTSRSNYFSKNGHLSILSNSDEYYHHNKSDAASVGQYGRSVRKPLKRVKHQKRVVYVGQIPITLGKPYLFSRFKKFGAVQNITLHKKPDFRVYYAFVTYSDKTEAERAINHGNDDKTQLQLDIRFGERKQTQTPYYDLDDEWLTDWYGYNSQPLAVVRSPQSPEKVSFEQELQEFHKLAQIKKSNHKLSQIS